MKTFFFLMVAAILMIPGLTEAEEKEGRGGLFSEGSFLSEAFSSVTDKLDKVASGEEKIIDDNARGMNERIPEYGVDPLGRSPSAQASDDYRNYRKKMMEKEAVKE